MGFGRFLKKSVGDFKFKSGVQYRKMKFSVAGFINAPNKGQIIINGLKNPKNYIPALKLAGYILALSIYVCIAVFISANLSNTGYTDVSNKAITVFPLHSGFSSEASGVSVKIHNNTVIELLEEETYVKLAAQVEPRFLSGTPILWETSDTDIAEVMDGGLLKIKRAGDVKLYASVLDGRYTDDVELRIVRPLEGLLMATSNVILYLGESGKFLKVRAFPQGAVANDLIWESKNEDVVMVDSSGRAEPVGLGMTEVTVSTRDRKFSAKSFVTVVNYAVSVDEIVIENEETELSVGETLNLVTTVKPYNAKNKTLFWSSDNEDVVKVNQTGRVKAVGEGETTVVAKSVNGVEAYINISVTESEESKTDGWAYSQIQGEGDTYYTSYEVTLPMLVDIQMGLNPPPKIWRNSGVDYATEAEVAEYINPASYCDGVYKYQFLDLASSNGVSAQALDDYLSDKGILSGTGEIFKRAAKLYNVSEVYLVAHACLETGNGTSELSTGVTVNGTTVYNMFGIAAYDNGAVESGSKKAYDEGWTTVESAILGGAEWISKFYINNLAGAQNTLYKMLWNPDNPGTHQYATDISWAIKQSEVISGIFDLFPEAVLSFNVPIYSGQNTSYISIE